MNASKVFLPIFLWNPRSDAPPSAFLGTGTLVADGVLVTAWHCVDVVPSAGEILVACERGAAGVYVPFALSAIERHPDGMDLAVARIEKNAEEPVAFLRGEPQMAMGVWTYGYPHTRVETVESERRFHISPRYLQGYVMRIMNYSPPSGGPVTPSLELDMSAPQGLSGAGLFLVPTDQLIGMVYGAHDVATIESFGWVNPDTGMREPEIQRVVSFGLAHHVESLRTLRGTATRGRPLGELIPTAGHAAGGGAM